MTTMTKDAPFWDKLAPKYAEQPVPDETAYAATLERTLGYLAPEDHVLELGAGTGTTALKLAPRVASYRATDVSTGMVAIAEGKSRPDGANLTFAVEGVGDAPAGEAPYDAVLAFNLLHLLPDLPGDLRKIRTRVKPGGLFISKTPCLGRRAWHIRAMVWLMHAVGKAPAYVGLFDVADYDMAVREAGFEIVETGLYPEKSRNRFVVARAV